MPARAAVVASVVACSFLGCGTRDDRAPRPGAPQPEHVERAPRVPDAGRWAERVRMQPSAPALARAPSDPASAAVARAAVMDDSVEDSDESVLVGRFVYRVSFAVPPSFRDHRARIEAPAGELHLDVSPTRLRARFVGPGFPVAEGAEVRLRGDMPGVYLFDELGGRSLGPGQLAAWFEGLHDDRDTQTRVAVWREVGARARGPLATELVCAFLAEWAHHDRDALAHRCEGGSLPPLFRVGPWTGELTAVVPMQLPRRALRADDAAPPKLAPVLARKQLLEASAVARLRPSRPEQVSGPEPVLRVHNHTPSRALLVAQGVAIAWIDAGMTLEVEGFAPGHFRMGAVRPLGVLRMPPKLVRVPGELHLGTRER